MSGRSRTAVRAAGVLLLAGAMVLAVLVWVRATDATADAAISVVEDIRRLDQPVVGLEHTIVLPSVEVSLRVAPPTRTLEDDGKTLRAPEGGALVPVAWQVRSLTGLTGEPVEKPTELTLVSGERRVALDSVSFVDSEDYAAGLERTSRAIAVDGNPGLDDLTVEVSFDGLTQVLHPATGEIDAGAARTLYEPQPAYTTGCETVETSCSLRAVDRAAPLRPDRASFIASAVRPYPHSSSLGWAEEGRLWLTFRIQVFGATAAVDSAGGYRLTERGGSTTSLRLDGVEPVERDPLASEQLGFATFSVDADAVPGELELEVSQRLQGKALPVGITVRAVRKLRVVGLG